MMHQQRMRHIQKALKDVSDAFYSAAKDEMMPKGSVHDVYFLMKESIAMNTKARSISRRFGVNDCDCGES